MPDLLSSLTAERLEELAKRQDGVIGFLAAHGYNDEYLMNFVNAAAALRALAKAEQAMQRDPSLSCEYGDWGVAGGVLIGFGWLRHGGGFAKPGVHPTLLAALGSVGQQEKHDG